MACNKRKAFNRLDRAARRQWKFQKTGEGEFTATLLGQWFAEKERKC